MGSCAHIPTSLQHIISKCYAPMRRAFLMKSLVPGYSFSRDAQMSASRLLEPMLGSLACSRHQWIGASSPAPNTNHKSASLRWRIQFIASMKSLSIPASSSCSDHHVILQEHQLSSLGVFLTNKLIAVVQNAFQDLTTH